MEQNLSGYYIFHMVAKNKSISGAAKELFISQPAISKAIHKLEESLDTKLFVRQSRGVALTEEGQILYAHTATAFDSLSQGEELLREHNSQGIGQLRIGASTTLCKYLLLPVLGDFMRKHPGIKVSIHCQSTFETVKLLEDNKIDIGLTGKIKNLSSLSFEKLGDFQDIFVSTRDYLDTLERQDGSNEGNILGTCNLMLLDEDNISRLYINQYLQLHNIEIKHVLEISTMDLLIEFAKIGLGVACVIKEFVKEDLNNGNLVEIHIPEPIKKRGVGFAYSKHGMNEKSVQSFLSFIEQSSIYQ